MTGDGTDNSAAAEPAEISSQEARRLMDGHGAAFVDVRQQWETTRGIIEGAIRIPFDELEEKKDLLPLERNATLIVYCAVGMRSVFAIPKLAAMGYGSVYSLEGGITAWIREGYPVVDMKSPFGQDEYERYSRQIILRQMGEEGQLKLASARVLIVGAGGLGCPAALYLAACGIGTIGIVDFDRVELSNLNRQVLHGTADVGVPKVRSARESMSYINPLVNVLAFDERLDVGNVRRVLEDFDMVVDGSDTIQTKFLLNDACFFAGKPYIFGGAVGFDGQAGVFHPKGGGPCLRCMFPKPPPQDRVQNCNEAGVLGIVPGQIGLVQAMEAVKLIAGIGRPMMGRFFVYNALEAYYKTIEVDRNPDCPLCGDNPGIRELRQEEGGVCSGRR
jgi:molybdopterin/thiamine biosynthesis adenylyltransferase/rhodanese-related sulfurtransferase